MGKAAMLGTLAVSFAVVLFMKNTFFTSQELERWQWEQEHNTVAREVAQEARQMILAGWLESGGQSTSPLFTSTSIGSGDAEVLSYSVSNGVLDFVVRGTYEESVHDIRSRYQWNNFAISPFQIKAADLNISIDQGSAMNMESITFDDQSIKDLDELLVQELGLAEDLSEMELGMNRIKNKIESELSASGKSGIGLNMVDDTQRDKLDKEDGMFYPGQVDQAVAKYLNDNPGSERIVNDANGLINEIVPGTDDLVYRVKGDMDLYNTVEGKGILIIEGDLTVQSASSLKWEGLVIVRPPAEEMNPQVKFVGDVEIQGALIAVHEGMPNTGHMDFTTWYDDNGTWSQSSGRSYAWLRHTHDFSGRYGYKVVYMTDRSGVSSHSSKARLDWTLNKFSSSTDMFFELYNTHKHGRALVTLDIDGEGSSTSSVPAGFDESIADDVNVYRTKTFKIRDLNHLDIDVTRLSSLRKMWDSGPDGYPGCPSYRYLGPGCVSWTFNRYDSFTLRAYVLNADGSERKVYESSLYWHRRQDEEEEFENEMTELVDDIKHEDYGLDIDLGSRTNITANAAAVAGLNIFGTGGLGVTHLGTWHGHYVPSDEKNPVRLKKKITKEDSKEQYERQ